MRPTGVTSYPIQKLILFLLVSLLFIGQAQASYLQVTNTSTVQTSNLTEYSTTSGSYVKLSTIIPLANISGVVTIKFDITGQYNDNRCGSSNAYACGQLRKNGINIGAEQVNTIGSYQTKVQNISLQLNVTDTLELWAENCNSGGCTGSIVKVKNFTISYDYVPAPTILTPANNSAQTSRIVNITTNASGGIQYQISQQSDFSALIFNVTTSNSFSGNLTLPTGLNYIRVRGYDITNDSVTNWSNTTQVKIMSNIYDINTSGLVGWWHLDDNLNDSSGRNHNGSVVGTGTTYNSGHLNNGTSFSGNGYINTGNITDYDFGSGEPFTLLAWINTSNISTSGEHDIVSDLGVNLNGYYWYFTNTSGIEWMTFAHSCDGFSNVASIAYNHSGGAQLTKNKFHLLTITSNTTNSYGLNYYFDGTITTAVGSGSYGTNCKSNSPIYIGALPYDGARNWSGMLDEVQVYNRSLSQSDITTLYYDQMTDNSYPNATSWGNTRTNNNSLDIIIYRNANITFNASVNQSSTGYWINATKINETFGYYNFISQGSYNISYFAQNNNGTSNIITWNISYIPDTIPPAQVLGLTNISTSDIRIDLQWNANNESDLWGYEVFKNGTHYDYTQLNQIAVTGLTELTSYNFTVRANDTVYSNWGVNSSSIIVKTIHINSHYIDPTRLNTGEVWLVNTTEIRIQGDKPIANATLYWQPTRGSEIRVDSYLMNEINSTVFNYTFTGLNDGDYPYHVFVNYTDGTNDTLPSYYVTIDFDIVTPQQAVYLWQRSDKQYLSNPTTLFEGYDFIEPEWKGWTETSHSSTLIKRCYNSTTDIFWDNQTCNSGESNTSLAYVMPSWHPYLYQLIRYKNSSGYYATLINRNPPTGYTQDIILGYAMPMMPHVQDIYYINNSKIKLGVDCRYGGAGVYLASMDNLSKNYINNYDSGRQIQTSYYDDANPAENYTTGIVGDPWGWNPTLAGNTYSQPSNVSYCYVDNNSLNIYVDKLAQWNPSYNNGRYSDLGMYITYIIDNESNVVDANYTYIHHGNVTHLRYTQESPTIYGIKELRHMWFKNSSILYEDTPIYNGLSVYYSQNSDMVFVAMLNDSDYGIGIWNYKRPQLSAQNFSLGSTAGSSYDIATNKIDVWPYITFNKTGEIGSIGSNIGRIYLGDKTSMDSYFSSLEFGIEFDPSVQINQSIAGYNLTIKVNNTDIAQINNATLHWINSTGTYDINMTVSELKNSASYSFPLLNSYNYTFNVSSYATTEAYFITPTVWVNLSNLPPVSITNLQNTKGTTYVNWTWTDPSDVDFDHVEIYLDGIWKANVSAGIQYHFNGSLLPNTDYTISTRTVDTVGNVNQTWVNQTVTTLPLTYIPANPVWVSNITGSYWANHTWQAGSGNATDSFNVSHNGTWTNGTSITSLNASLNPLGWSNITIWAWNNTGYLSLTSISNNSQAPAAPPAPASDYIPPMPTGLTSSSGNFYIRWDWTAGAGNVTDSYNVSFNGVWTNGSSALFKNQTLSSHAWGNISVCSYNNTGRTGACASGQVQISNNPITISGISDTYTINEGQTLNIDANYADTDGDTGTFSDNSTKWNINSGNGVVSWTASYSDSGVYAWEISVADGYGSTSTKAFIVTVNDVVISGFNILTTSATEQTTDGATLNADATGVAIPSVVWFEYSGSPYAYPYKTSNQTISVNSSISVTLKGMPFISNKPYYYRAVASDGINMYYGNQMNFMTASIGTITNYAFDKNFNNLTNSNLNITNMTAVGASPYVDVLGNIFWGLLFALIFVMIWMRQEDITIPALLGLIIGASLWSSMPSDWTSMAMSMTVISFAGLMYSIIKGRQ